MPTRLGLFDGRLISLFPRKLANTARSSTLLQGTEYATYLENLIPNDDKAGSGAKRFGVGAKGSPVSGADIKEIMEYRKSDGTIQFLVYCSDGTLRTYDESTGLYTTVKSGLNTDGLLYWTAFNEKLIVVNGLDQPFSWDGSAVADLGEYVEDFGATSETQVDTNTITLVPLAGRSDYAVGQSIRVTFATAGAVTATISSVTGTTTLTIDVSGTPFPNPIETITSVEYYDKPPAFSFIFAEHNRLWALSPGESKPRTFRGPNPMKVYYTDTTNNENTWYNQSGSNPTQELNAIDITNKSRGFDELVAISSLQGVLAFHGRRQTFLYSGDDPQTVGGFIWEKTIPVGTLSGKLLQEFPGDVLFCTETGLRSLQKVYTTESLEVVDDLGTAIESTISDKIPLLVGGDDEYRSARSFSYARAGMYGFRFDNIALPVYILNEESRGWTFFTGLFKDASAFLGTTDGRLLLAVGGQLYAYGNGTDSDAGECYDDAGESYEWQWESPWMQLGGQRWANKAFEIIMETAVTGTLYVDRLINWNTQNVYTSEFPITVTGGLWDTDLWDATYWDGSVINPVASDKFICDAFKFKLRSDNSAGPYAALGVRPIGR